MSDAMCACNEIRFAPQDAGGGLVRESWACRACGGRFMRADDLADLRRKIRVLAGEAEDRRDYIAGLEKRIAKLEAERDEARANSFELAKSAACLLGILELRKEVIKR